MCFVCVASRCARGPQRRGSLNAEAQCRGRGARGVPLERQPSGRDASRALRVPPALARASAASRAQSLRRPTPRRRRNAGRSLVAAGCTSQRVPLRLLYYENSARRRRPPAQLRCPPLQHRRPRLEFEREFAARVFTSRTLHCALPYRTVWSAPTRPVLTSHLISLCVVFLESVTVSCKLRTVHKFSSSPVDTIIINNSIKTRTYCTEVLYTVQDSTTV